jgi:choline dehydrogenase-like flavoprotein
MQSAEIIVVGGGPSGTFAAWQLRGRGVLVLDVGHRPEGASTLDGNLYDLRKEASAAGGELFEELIGSDFESLHNVFHAYLSPKLKSPRMRFVTQGAAELSPVRSDNFDALISFAAGGMANAWGAGLYRFTDDDLSGYPIGVKDLEPFYEAITAKVGISGTDDDLSRFFGPALGLQPPVEIGASGRALLARYARRRGTLNRLGLYIGRPRLAVLTREHDGRPPYRYEALEFFRPGDPAVYTPLYTLDEMIRRGEIDYRPGLLVERYAEGGAGITVTARECAGGRLRTFACKRLILAAGTLGSAKIALRSNEDYSTALPLLDPNLSYIPLVDPARVGGALDKRVYSAAMLNAVYAGDRYPRPVQMTLYGVVGTLRSDYLFDFPLSVRGNLAAARYLTPALVLIQLSYPDAPAPGNRLRLALDGRLELRYADKPAGALEAPLLALFRRIGYLGAPALCRRLTPGNSYRYAGTLPMTATPTERYQTDRNGLLCGTRGVYVADAATLSPLPSKNHSFTMMANAMRIADHVGRTLA